MFLVHPLIQFWLVIDESGRRAGAESRKRDVEAQTLHDRPIAATTRIADADRDTGADRPAARRLDWFRRTT